MAHVEIFILNYNGGHFLGPCLDSLARCDHGDHTVVVNVVDNASSDNSRSIVEEQYPWVQYIALPENYGFSRGNNEGVRIRQRSLEVANITPDFFVFLNNDTVVERDWLTAGVSTFAGRPSVGVVGSKSRFMDKFIVLTLSSSHPFLPSQFGSGDSRALGVYWHDGHLGENVNTQPGRMKFPDAFGREGGGRWLRPSSSVFIPVTDPTKPTPLTLYLSHHHPGHQLLEVAATLAHPGGHRLAATALLEHGVPFQLQVPCSPGDYCTVIQNAGSFVTTDYNAGDRGFLEVDAGQFDEEALVAAICGVSLFMRAPLFSSLGGFDERYFAYFEDTDLSLRARLAGYECVYQPGSVLNHVHCGSGVEHSDYFVRNVAYSQLLFQSKLLPRKAWRSRLTEYRRYAGPQLGAFEQDRDLTGKPHLRALCKYYKQYPSFLLNRWYQLRCNPAKQLSRVLQEHTNL